MTQIFIVTGAASGIGYALTQQLLARGDGVLACDNNPSGLQALAASVPAGSNLQLQSLDVRSPEQWAAAISAALGHWGRIDVLANVAGVLRENWVHQATCAEVDFHFDINVKGTIFGMQAVLPHMLEQKAGHIINIASLAALAPVPGLGLYSASKFAVRGYSLAAALELAPKGIFVTAVCPDAVQTPMLDIQKNKEQTALTFSGPRALSANEVADAILGPVLRNKPMEIALPEWRGATAKFAGTFPALGAKALGLLRKAGLKRQSQIAAGQDSTKN